MGRKGLLLDRLRRLQRDHPALMPMGKTLGFCVESIEPGSAAVVVDTSKRHANMMGVTHGGLLFALADTAIGLAHLGLLVDGETSATVEMKINFLRPVWKTRLRAEANAVQHGKNLCVFECDVRDAKRRLAARATATMMSLTGEQAEGRAHFAFGIDEPGHENDEDYR